MGKNGKKKFPLWAKITAAAVTGALSVGLIVGTSIAYQYEGLLNTFFARSDYSMSEEEKKVCGDIVREGAVLLKNEDKALPLSADEKKLAVFGQNSVDFVYGGAGSGAVNTDTAPTLKAALEHKDHGGFTVDAKLWDFYANGGGRKYRKSYPNEQGQGTFAVNEVPRSVLEGDSSALSGLVSDDVAIVTIGRSGGESSDLPLNVLPTGYRYLQVDSDERDTVKLACENFDKVILIVNANNPVELGFLEEADYANVKAALWVGGVGQEGLYGLADIICGNASPSGRLSDTYAYDSTSAPSFSNMGDFTIANADKNVSRANKYLVYGEGIYVGYRYYETRYEDAVNGAANVGDYDYKTQVQFPFGYGLSYTTFEYSDMTVAPTADGKAYEVTVDVKNTGDVGSKAVVQVYAQKPYTGRVESSAVELVGFAKTDVIPAGETATDVKLEIDKSVFASYDSKTAKTYIVDAGEHYLAVGDDCHDALNNILAAKGKTTADGMTAAGDAELAKKAFTQTTVDATSYSKSAVTGGDITNRFDDVSIEYYDPDFKYVSRADWTGTLASSANYKNKSWTAPDELISDLKWNRSDEVINDTSLSSPVLDSKSTAYKVTDLIGVDYGDKKWEQLVSQLSWSDISKLVRIGGYSTLPIESIGLPATTDKDGPSGFSGTLVGGVSSMAWPAEVVMASTWNSELIEHMGELIGDASIITGTAGWYAPGIDIHRSPYSGRNFEYFSEDGLLSGKIGAAEMRGVRSKGVMAYMKHFALNDQETNRYGGAFFADEQAIREVFLKGFEYPVTEGGAVAVMVSMNRLGATWAGAHKGLMTDVLRGEWGFKGMAITDQASVTAMYYQDMISGLWAGTDLWLNSNNKLWPLANYDESIGGYSGTKSYKDNATVTHHLQRAAKNIIYAVTNSNAAQSYSDDVTSSASVFNWKALLWSVDAIVWAGFAALAAWLTLTLVRDRKKPEQPAAAEGTDNAETKDGGKNE